MLSEPGAVATGFRAAKAKSEKDVKTPSILLPMPTWRQGLKETVLLWQHCLDFPKKDRFTTSSR